MNTNPYLFFGLGSAALSLVSAALSFLFFDTSLIASWFIGTSLSVLFLMGLDKSLAKGRSLRVPEKVLFTTALAGGAAAMFIAMRFFRWVGKTNVFS